MISRCSSPIPEMSVCPVSSSRHAERRVLLGEALQALPELVLVGLRLRLDRDRDDGVGERHRLEHDRRRVDGERVAGGRDFRPDGGGDLAGADLVALLAVVGVHLQDAADPLGLARRRVQHRPPALAGVDAEVRELADVRVGHDLEGEAANGASSLASRTISAPSSGRRPAPAARRAGSAGSRRRVEQRLHALVLEGGAEQHGRDRARGRAGAQRAPDHLRRHRRLVLEVRLRQLVVELGDRVDELRGGTPRPARGARPGSRPPRRGAEVVEPGTAFISTRSTTPAWCSSCPIGSWHRHRVRAEPLAHRLHGGEEVRAGSILLMNAMRGTP